MTYDQQKKDLLLQLARKAIEHRLQVGTELTIRLTDYPDALRVPHATFVTLHVAGELHGCIGILEPRYPLVLDVARNAASAAFSDPRFPPLTTQELPDLEIEISILGTPEPITFDSEADLLQKIRPNIDGLILEEGNHHATFLPAVWETLPNPIDFLKALKQKAGLKPDYWSDRIRIQRYTTEVIS